MQRKHGFIAHLSADIGKPFQCFSSDFNILTEGSCPERVGGHPKPHFQEGTTAVPMNSQVWELILYSKLKLPLSAAL